MRALVAIAASVLVVGCGGRVRGIGVEAGSCDAPIPEWKSSAEAIAFARCSPDLAAGAEPLRSKANTEDVLDEHGKARAWNLAFYDAELGASFDVRVTTFVAVFPTARRPCDRDPFVPVDSAVVVSDAARRVVGAHPDLGEANFAYEERAQCWEPAFGAERLVLVRSGGGVDRHYYRYDATGSFTSVCVEGGDDDTRCR